MTIKEFIIKALSDQDGPSSKRVLGGILILTYVACLVFLVVKYGATEITKALLETGLMCGSGLVGLGIFENISKNKE